MERIGLGPQCSACRIHLPSRWPRRWRTRLEKARAGSQGVGDGAVAAVGFASMMADGGAFPEKPQ